MKNKNLHVGMGSSPNMDEYLQLGWYTEVAQLYGKLEQRTGGIWIEQF